MPSLVAIAVYLLLMVLGGRLLADADTYWHIALGRLEHHALPTGDMLTQTVHDAHWVAYKWLSELAYAAAILSPKVARKNLKVVARAFSQSCNYGLRF